MRTAIDVRCSTPPPKFPERLRFRMMVLLAGIAASLSVPSVDAQLAARAVAISGQTAVPGSGGTFTAFVRPVIDNSGHVAFAGEYAGQSGLFIAEPAGFIADIVRTDGDFAPGTTSQFFGFMGGSDTISLNDDGEIAFVSSYHDGTVFHRGIWSNHTGVLSDVAREGVTEAPGSGGLTIINITTGMCFTTAGVAFAATSQLGDDTSTRVQGFYTTPGGALTKIVQSGELAPGASAPFIGFWYPMSLNGTGEVSFLAEFNQSGATTGVFRYGPPGVDVARANSDNAPGASSPFSSVGFSDMNGDGTVVLCASYAAGAQEGIFVFANDTLGDLMRSDGDPFPGTPWHATSFERPRVNAAGHTGFFSSFIDEAAVNHSGIFTTAAGAPALVARRSAEPAPGSSNSFYSFLYSPGFAMNSRGQVAFVGLTSAADRGIWATHGPGRDLVAVAQRGQSWNLDGLPGGDSRVIESVEMVSDSGGEDGRPRAFNDSGELVFKLGFTTASGGGEGVYVATVPFHDTPKASYGYSVGTGAVPTLYRFSPLSGVSYPAVKLSPPADYPASLDVEGLCVGGDGLLWAVDCDNDTLITINPVSGVVTLVGTLGVGADDVGLSFGPGGQLFMADAGTGALYTVDTGSGAATQVGALGAPIDSLAWRQADQTLYGMTEDLPNLYTINPVTGEASLLSSLMAVPQTNNTGMTVDRDGVLWGMWEDTNPTGETTVIFTVDDPQTGATTIRGTITDPDPLAGQFESFAMDSGAAIFADGFESGSTSAWE